MKIKTAQRLVVYIILCALTMEIKTAQRLVVYIILCALTLGLILSLSGCSIFTQLDSPENKGVHWTTNVVF